ncbi:MAG: response regulator [Deltaproteobacteria bacterium]|jgi:two-component system, sensor histidine kinase|nr:response regulator [Deltaproteobacteria bacterium]MBT4525528.1 response regulator [Deltaproteobacteria bacterium]
MENRTVLIVEDNRGSRELLDLIIRREGFKTILAENGVEAFKIMKQHEQEIDLVITDFMMPEMDGEELCMKIRKELGNKTVPVIFLSALNERDSILKIFKAGASDYVVKPFAKEELMARVGVHLKTMVLNRQKSFQVKELKRLSKMKDDLLAITSHDLRAPLNGILGFTDLLLCEDSFTDTQREYLTHVKDSGGFLLSLINDILDLGRLQSEDTELDKTVLPLEKVVASSVNTIRHMASPKKIELVLTSKIKEPAYVLGNEASLIRIFNNILSNAIKFTPIKGEISIELVLINNKSQVSTLIIDNGIGIAKDKLPKLFSKYSNISRVGTAGEKGTGLGMSITKELVERHNGSISVDSEVDKGTSFQLIFPLVDKSETVDSKASSKTPVNVKEINDKNHLKILLADDNQLNIKLAATVFKKNGYDIVCVKDGLQAKNMYIDSLNSSEEGFNLIFMDLQMPVLGGVEATEQIREYEADLRKKGKNHQITPVKIIAMTAASSDKQMTACKKAGMNDFITKPISMEQINKVIKRHINH